MELAEPAPTTKLPAEWFIEAHPGEVVTTPPGEEHRHGAAPGHFMTHLALWEGDDTTWLEHVPDDVYGGPRTGTRARR